MTVLPKYLTTLFRVRIALLEYLDPSQEDQKVKNGRWEGSEGGKTWTTGTAFVLPTGFLLIQSRAVSYNKQRSFYFSLLERNCPSHVK